MTTVREIMTSECASVALSTPAIKVAQQMKTSGAGTIPVCDKGGFCGIITERAIVIGVVAASGDAGTIPAGALMDKDWPTVSPNEDVWRAANLMADRSIKVLPVVQDGKLVGLLRLSAITQKNPTLAAMAYSKSLQSKAYKSEIYKYKVTISDR